MKTSKWIKLTFCLLLVTVMFTTTVYSEEIKVIVNKSNALSSISADDLKNIYLGRKTLWDGGEKITLYDHEKIKTTFIEKFLNTTKSKYMKFWMKKMLSGKGNAPKNVGSDEEMIKKVSGSDGAIGYVNAAAVTSAVKVLEVK